MKEIMNLENHGHCLAIARCYAREHPEESGYIVFGKEAGAVCDHHAPHLPGYGGGKYYSISGGKASPAAAIDCRPVRQSEY